MLGEQSEAQNRSNVSSIRRSVWAYICVHKGSICWESEERSRDRERRVRQRREETGEQGASGQRMGVRRTEQVVEVCQSAASIKICVC